MRRAGKPTADEMLAERPEPARVDVVPVSARLFGVEAAARYLGGISPWTLRALIADGHLHPVRLPSVRHRGGSGRRVLLDVTEVDALIDRLRRESSGEPDAQLSGAALKGWERRRRREADRG